MVWSEVRESTHAVAMTWLLGAWWCEQGLLVRRVGDLPLAALGRRLLPFVVVRSSDVLL